MYYRGDTLKETWKKIAVFLLAIVVIVTSFMAGNYMSIATKNKVTMSREEYDKLVNGGGNFKNLQPLKELIQNNFLFEIDNNKLEEYVYKGLFQGLEDPYSVYMNKDEFKSLMESSKGEFAGVGIVVTATDDGFITVVSAIEGTPAYKEGIKSGDRIIKVGEENFSGEQMDKAVEIMRGKPGTEVKLTLSRDNKDKKKKYIVSGVYNTNYQNIVGINYPIYTSYFSEDLLSSYLKQESYEFYEKTLTVNEVTKEFNESMINDFSSYTKSVGTGNAMMVVKVDDAKNLSNVTKELETIYPYYHQISQYDLKSGELSSIYRNLVRILVVGSLVISLIEGILISFLNKGYIYNRSKELAILYSLGFKKIEIFKIILLENGILFTFYSMTAYILVYFSNTVYLSKTRMFQLFDNIFEPFNILVTVLLIALMMTVSIVWGLAGVKQTNLKKYLNQ